jgi:hypothetical protein
MPSQALENAETLISRLPPSRGEITPVLDERASTDVEESSDESEDDDSPVKRKRAQSLDSARNRLRNKKIVYLNPKSKTLSTEQEQAVEAATSLLTQEQKDQVQRRQDKVMIQNEEDDSSEPGPSQNKGKTIDPREWGNAGIDPEELNANIQEALINSYERGRKDAKINARKPKNRKGEFSRNMGNGANFQIPPVSRQKSIASLNNAQQLETRRAGSRPAAQLVPESSLGMALGKVAQLDGDPDDDDPSDNSSEFEGSDYSYSSTEIGYNN